MSGHENTSDTSDHRARCYFCQIAGAAQRWHEEDEQIDADE